MFEIFPSIKYSIDGVTYDVANIFKQIEFNIPDFNILKTLVNYGERPDQISQRLYGRPDYYWAIIIANRSNPFIDPVDRLGETAVTTSEYESGGHINSKDFFFQFGVGGAALTYPILIDDILCLEDSNDDRTYYKVTKLDKAFKRIFVTDLSEENIERKFVAGTDQVFVVRKNNSGFYDIVYTIDMADSYGIFNTKTLFKIAKYYDISNMNPSVISQFNSYLTLLNQYLTSTLDNLQVVGSIKPLINQNPIEINYYPIEIVESLASDLVTILQA